MDDDLQAKLQALNQEFFLGLGIISSQNLLVTGELECFIYCKKMTIAGAETDDDRLVQFVITDFQSSSTITYKLAIDHEVRASFGPRQVTGARIVSVSESFISEEGGLKHVTLETSPDRLFRVLDAIIRRGAPDNTSQPTCAGDLDRTMIGDFSHIPLYALLKDDTERRRWSWEKGKMRVEVGPDFANTEPEDGIFRGEITDLPKWVKRPHGSPGEFVDRAGEKVTITRIIR